MVIAFLAFPFVRVLFIVMFTLYSTEIVTYTCIEAATGTEGRVSIVYAMYCIEHKELHAVNVMNM